MYIYTDEKGEYIILFPPMEKSESFERILTAISNIASTF